MSETTLERKCAGARKLLKTLERKGLLAQEQSVAGRDPLRAPAIRMRAEFNGRHEQVKLTRIQRELIAYLELHPGSHNLLDLGLAVQGASVAARALARRKLVDLKPEPLAIDAAWAQPRHALNPPQQAAVDAIRGALAERRFQTFLLHGVTGSGKTEVYLNAIEAALAAGRGVLMLVPEIGLTPAMAGQFHARFGDRVAILHSAFNDSERAGAVAQAARGRGHSGRGNALGGLRAGARTWG